MVVKIFFSPDNGRMVETTICIKLGKRIRLLRKKYKLTQEELSARANISTKYLQNLEGKNPKTASIITIEKLAKAFNLTPSKFLEI